MTADAPKRSVEQHAAIPGANFPRGSAGLARLLKHSDFDRVYKQGRRHFSSHLTVFYLRRTEAASAGVLPGASPENVTRVGFTVGRALGGAVDRNRIKRRMREAVRRNLPTLSTPVDVVLHPRRSVIDLKFATLDREVANVFRAIQVAVEKQQNASSKVRRVS